MDTTHHIDMDSEESKGSQLKDKLSHLSDKASSMAGDLQERTDRSMQMLGEKLTGIAGTVREKTGLTAVADKLESGGQFLSQHTVNDLSTQATGLIRQHPTEAMLVGLGIGVLLGSLLSARRVRS